MRRVTLPEDGWGRFQAMQEGGRLSLGRREGQRWRDGVKRPTPVGEADDTSRTPGRLQADQVKGEMRFGGIIAQGLGQVRLVGQAQEADRQVPEGGHDLWGGVRADLGAVFVKGHIPDPVQAVLDGPMPPAPLQQVLRRGPLRRRARDRKGDVLAQRAPGEGRGDPFNPQDLPRVGKCQIVLQRGADPDAAGFDPAMPFVNGLVLRGEMPPAPARQYRL